MENEVKVTEPIQVEPKVEAPQVEEPKKVSSTEIVRTLSKKFGIDLFKPENIEAFEDMVGKKDTELETYKTKVSSHTENEKLFAQKEEKYQVQIEALKLGIKEDKIDEAVALAKVKIKEGQNLSDGLKLVAKEYGNIFTTPKQVGMQFRDVPGDDPDVAKSEAEKYLNKSTAYQAWQKQQERLKLKK